MPKSTQPKSKDTVRLNLEVSQQVRDRIKALAAGKHAASMSEVIRHSIKLYALALEIKESGGKLIHQPKEGPPETIILL